MNKNEEKDVKVMEGLTLSSVIGKEGYEDITFTSTCGRTFRLTHYGDCCEDVYVESIVGDLEDLCGVPLLISEEVSNLDDFNENEFMLKEYGENFRKKMSYTWTFYKFATIKGYVTIRWFGESNGYYSESVTFEEVKS